LRNTKETGAVGNLCISLVKNNQFFVNPGPELEGSTLVVGGDGRFFMTDAVDIIIKESSNYQS
jgi:hypothetical protein